MVEPPTLLPDPPNSELPLPMPVVPPPAAISGAPAVDWARACRAASSASIRARLAAAC